MPGMFAAFNINASGMTAQRYRMDVISENVANANTTRAADGEPYRRRIVAFAEKGAQTAFRKVLGDAIGDVRRGYSGQGVKVSRVYEDTTRDLKMVYDPSHPDADVNGYVHYPNVEIVEEMTNMIDASRAYEANATAFSASKAMCLKALDMNRA